METQVFIRKNNPEDSRVYEKIFEGIRISSKNKHFQLNAPENWQIFEQDCTMNCDDVSIDAFSNLYLYKTMKFEYVRQMLVRKQLRLENTSSWDDKYENFFLKERFFMKGVGSVDARSHIWQTFGQSWTTIEESDAFWRIYSPDHKSVKIKVNARKLIESILIDELSLATTFIGRVEYCSVDDINTNIKESVDSAGFQKVWGRVMPKMFFYKRDEFSHEQEFRIIRLLDSDEYRKYSPSYVVYDIEPNSLIEEICFDSRLCQCEYKERKQILLDLGYEENRICQSQINNFSPINIELRTGDSL